MKRFLILFVFLYSYTLNSQDFVFDYIENYKDVSIDKMNRYGIPASITLAQGMLESNWGRSDLAVKANNHFGIKCGNDWTGPTFSWEDDEYKNGNIVKSCFRVYNSVSESFDDHSAFLSKKRYRFLYDYGVYDYKSWAKGLVKAGYATDPKYADKLIFIIEKYNLFEFDSQYRPAEYADNTVPISNTVPDKKQKPVTVVKSRNNALAIDYINGSKVIYAKAGETLSSLSDRIGIPEKKILRYNDGIKKNRHRFKEGDIVFLEKKKRKYYGKDDIYITGGKESLASISQKFGMSLKYLAKINKIKTKIKFRKGRKVLLKPVWKRQEWTVNTEKKVKKYLFEEALSPEN